MDFVVKAKEARAHIAILASSSEFHEDSFDVAYEYALRLLTLETINTTSVSVLTRAFDLVLHLHQFRFQTERENDAIGLPEEPCTLKFFMNEMRIVGPEIDTVPERLLEAVKDEVSRAATGAPQLLQIPLPKGTVIEHPNTCQRTHVTGFSFMYRLLSACDLPMTDDLETTPYLSETSAEEELVKRNPAADASSIKTGFNTRLRTGTYYYNPKLRFSYLCEKTEKRAATMMLVESYQGGQLFQARIVLSKQQSKQFVEVTEQGEIERLAKMYDKLSISDKDLEGRFKIFAKHIDKAECIDDLVPTPQQVEKQKRKNKADYFFNNREITCELKSLHTDTSWKIEKILAPYKETPEWPIIYGTVDLQQVLKHIPDGDNINVQIVEAVTDSLEGAFEQANRQIRDTKAIFDLPNSGGLLIILNDLVDVLSPELI